MPPYAYATLAVHPADPLANECTPDCAEAAQQLRDQGDLERAMESSRGNDSPSRLD